MSASDAPRSKSDRVRVEHALPIDLSPANGAPDVRTVFWRSTGIWCGGTQWVAGQRSEWGQQAESPSARVSAIVLRDPAAAATLEGRQLTAYAGNAVTESGARWVRIDGW